tara:strand:+ start:383 stop:556 length:174 start_codon:yes stop_codon:yes gene_type:complete
LKDYAAIAKEFYAAMIDAKAIGEHAMARYYHSQYLYFENESKQAGQPDINCTDIGQT